MDAPQYSGSVEELPDILGCWDAHERLAVWRDAAVARHLSEAGAVHPAVHTPNRVQQWLAEHEWRHEPSPDPKRLAVEWANGRARLTLYVPQRTSAVDYAARVDEVLSTAAIAADLPFSQVLAEVAAMPEEWAW